VFLRGFFYDVKKLLLRYPTQASAAWAVVIFILCATPGRYIPSADWLELLSFDKLVHASIFFILGLLLLLSALSRSMSRQASVTLLFAGACYGVLLEVGQARFFSGRTMDVFDAIANTIGIFLSLLLYRRLKAAIDSGIT
jgi:VanZ family protein